MTEQEHPAKSAPTNGQAKHAIPSGCVISLEIAAIIILAALIYNTLFPRAYWQSRELEQNLAKQSRQLEQNLARWESRHITHYRMSLDLPFSSATYSRMPLTVEVRDGKVMSVVNAQGQKFSPENDLAFHYDYPQAFTIPGLFSIASDWISKKPPSINVSYDPVIGYPDSIEIDPWTEPCCQWMYYSVRDFEVLPP